MKLSRTAKFYRENPEAREKHRKTSSDWNKSEKGKKYLKDKQSTPEEKEKNRSRKRARRKVEKAHGGKLGKNVHVDHKNKNAKDNSGGNLRVMSASKNLRRNKK